MAEVSKAVIEYLGTQNYDEDLLLGKLTSLLGVRDSLETEKEGLAEDVDRLQKEVEELKKREPLAQVGETYLKDLRTRAESAYRLIKDGEPSEEMLKVIREAGLEQIKAMLADFEAEKAEKIPGYCPNCGKPAKALIYRTSKEIEEERKTKEDNGQFKLKSEKELARAKERRQ
jgi:hypothetical protein